MSDITRTQIGDACFDTTTRTFETTFVKGPGWHFVHNLVKRLEREQFRRLRPYRKVKRRALSRQRIEDTRRWHRAKSARAIFEISMKALGLIRPDHSWTYKQDPYRKVKLERSKS